MIRLFDLLPENMDYVVNHNPPKFIIKIVNSVLSDKNTQNLLKVLNLNSPKISYIKDENEEAVARYMSGTTNNPHIVVNTETIELEMKHDPSRIGYAIESTIVHELIHAYLESKDMDTSEHDEDVVEDATREYMDFRNPEDLIKYLNDSYPNLNV